MTWNIAFFSQMTSNIAFFMSETLKIMGPSNLITNGYKIPFLSNGYKIAIFVALQLG